MNVLLIVVVIVCALGLVAALLGRSSRAADDGVAEFKRQLGALSPDASRPVVRPVNRGTAVVRDRDIEDSDEMRSDDGA